MISDFLGWLALLLPLAHWALVITLTGRLLSRRRAASELVGWLLVIWSVPFVGIGAYLFFGEPWLCSNRTRRARALERPVERLMARIDRKAPSCSGAGAVT